MCRWNWGMIMSEIYLSSLGESHSKWLSVRQSVIASNVANANTPGFKAKDVKPMGEDSTLFSNLATTDTRHITSGIGNIDGVATGRDESWEVYHSGGNVSLPQEMVKASEVAGAYGLNTSVMKSFHRMVISIYGN